MGLTKRLGKIRGVDIAAEGRREARNDGQTSSKLISMSDRGLRGLPKVDPHIP